ncbi:hypothetical protein KFE25_003069 [Diacronema lutheri]|uniref:RING-type E3 ubiquitin transferase n=1 Tax=Diacronema lutheri TaxID=2081491 RepID=A0A8J5X5W4_DIALT|nr:hypothetical protein KFE25_003069 [Diacronema lutheri]
MGGVRCAVPQACDCGSDLAKNLTACACDAIGTPFEGDASNASTTACLACECTQDVAIGESTRSSSAPSTARLPCPNGECKVVTNAEHWSRVPPIKPEILPFVLIGMCVGALLFKRAIGIALLRSSRRSWRLRQRRAPEAAPCAAPYDAEALVGTLHVMPFAERAARKARDDGCEDQPHRSSAPDCAICLGVFVAETRIAELHCGHIFCSACISSWVRSQAERPLCPLCKLEIFALPDASTSIIDARSDTRAAAPAQGMLAEDAELGHAAPPPAHARDAAPHARLLGVPAAVAHAGAGGSVQHVVPGDAPVARGGASAVDDDASRFALPPAEAATSSAKDGRADGRGSAPAAPSTAACAPADAPGSHACCGGAAERAEPAVVAPHPRRVGSSSDIPS